MYIDIYSYLLDFLHSRNLCHRSATVYTPCNIIYILYWYCCSIETIVNTWLRINSLSVSQSLDVSGICIYRQILSRSMVELQVPAGTQSMVDQFLHILIHGFIGSWSRTCGWARRNCFLKKLLWAFGDLTSRLTPNCKVWTHLISALASLCGMAVCWLDTDSCLILFDLALASHSTQSIDYNRSCSKYLYSVSSTPSLRVWVFTLNVASHCMLV